MSYVHRVANGLKISSSCHEKISLRDPHGRVLSLFRGFFRSNSSPVALLHSHSWSLRHFYGFGNQTYYKIRDRQLVSIYWVGATNYAKRRINRFLIFFALLVVSFQNQIENLPTNPKNWHRNNVLTKNCSKYVLGVARIEARLGLSSGSMPKKHHFWARSSARARRV